MIIIIFFKILYLRGEAAKISTLKFNKKHSNEAAKIIEKNSDFAAKKRKKAT